MDYKEIKSYEDACKALGVAPISEQAFNAFPKSDRANLMAYYKLTVITRAINDGWQPNWSDRDEEKYEPYYFTNSAGLSSAPTHPVPTNAYAPIGSRLCFRDYDRVLYAVHTFDDLYKAYFFPEKYQETEDAAEKETEQEAGQRAATVESEKGDTFRNRMNEVIIKHLFPVIDSENNNDTGCVFLASKKDVKTEEGKQNANLIAIYGNGEAVVNSIRALMREKGEAGDLYREAQKKELVEKLLSNILK